MALRLRHLFTTYGKIEIVPREGPMSPWLAWLLSLPIINRFVRGPPPGQAHRR